MSKLNGKIVGNTKKFLGEIVGDGKLVEEGDRQKSQSDSKQSEKDGDRPGGGPLGVNDLT